MAYTGVQGIGGKTSGSAKTTQQAALAQVRDPTPVLRSEAVMIVAGGKVITRQHMAALGIPVLNQMLISSGLQRANYEVRQSSASGPELRVNIDTRIPRVPVDVRTRITFSGDGSSQWMRTSADIGLNFRPERLASKASNVSFFGGLRITGEGVSATGSTSATVESPIGTVHGGSVAVTSRQLRYTALSKAGENGADGPELYARPTATPSHSPLSNSQQQAAMGEISSYLATLR